MRYMYLTKNDFKNWYTTMYQNFQKAKDAGKYTSMRIGDITTIINLSNGKSYTTRKSYNEDENQMLAVAICYAKATNKRVGVLVKSVTVDDISISDEVVIKDYTFYGENNKKTKRVKVYNLNAEMFTRGKCFIKA